MRTRAPGKLVVSGAYVVLEGAPCLVVAVDRYVTADSERAAQLLTPEVKEALARANLGPAPWFDASDLRAADRKLGLGSSAAIVVASLAAVWSTRTPDPLLAGEVFPLALAAHRAAQGGGSGVDVAAACFGGALWCQRGDYGSLVTEAAELPPALQLEVWSCAQAASTRDLLAAVRAFQARDAKRYRAVMAPAHLAAQAARRASSATELLAAIGQGYDALGVLGHEAGVPIVTTEMAALDRIARGYGCRFGPAGAGGGDVALHLGENGSAPRLRAEARALGLCRQQMRFAAPGLHRAR